MIDILVKSVKRLYKYRKIFKNMSYFTASLIALIIGILFLAYGVYQDIKGIPNDK